MVPTCNTHSHDSAETKQRGTGDRATKGAPASHRGRAGVNPERDGRERSSPVPLSAPPAGAGAIPKHRGQSPRDAAPAPCSQGRARAAKGPTQDWGFLPGGGWRRDEPGGASAAGAPLSLLPSSSPPAGKRRRREAAKSPRTKGSPCSPAEPCLPEPRAALSRPEQGGKLGRGRDAAVPAQRVRGAGGPGGPGPGQPAPPELSVVLRAGGAAAARLDARVPRRWGGLLAGRCLVRGESKHPQLPRGLPRPLA